MFVCEWWTRKSRDSGLNMVTAVDCSFRDLRYDLGNVGRSSQTKRSIAADLCRPRSVGYLCPGSLHEVYALGRHAVVRPLSHGSRDVTLIWKHIVKAALNIPSSVQTPPEGSRRYIFAQREHSSPKALACGLNIVTTLKATTACRHGKV